MIEKESIPRMGCFLFCRKEMFVFLGILRYTADKEKDREQGRGRAGPWQGRWESDVRILLMRDKEVKVLQKPLNVYMMCSLYDDCPEFAV